MKTPKPLFRIQEYTSYRTRCGVRAYVAVELPFPDGMEHNRRFCGQVFTESGRRMTALLYSWDEQGRMYLEKGEDQFREDGPYDLMEIWSEPV